MRLVLDHETQEVVSLREFEERTKLRCHYNNIPRAGSDSKGRDRQDKMKTKKDKLTTPDNDTTWIGTEKRKADVVKEGEISTRSDKRARL